MNKIALITDTTSDLTPELVNRYNVNVLSFRIIYKDREYRDKIEITPEQVYENLKVEVPTSSMPAMEDMESLYEKLEKEGYTHAIVVTLSSGLSGVYNGIKVVSENHPNIVTYICDSKSISLGEGAIVIECGKLIEKGKSFEEIVDYIPSFQKRVQLYFIVDTLEYLKKGGRIGKISGTIAELLNIKPIIGVDSNDGKYFTFDKVRGKKQCMNRIVKLASELLSKDKYVIYVMHGDGLEDAKKIYSEIKDFDNIIEITLGDCISPVSGVHTGSGLVGIVFVKEE